MSLTAAGDILESAVLTNLAATPPVVATSGEGAKARTNRGEDYVTTTSAIVQNSTYLLGPRIPTNAKIKKVSVFGKSIDTNATSAGAADINVIFSDAPNGGLAANPAVLDGTSATNASQIPTSAFTGATTSMTAYSSPNKLFGSAYVLNGNSGAVKNTDQTFVNGYTFAATLAPFWNFLGYTSDPGGFINFFVVITTAPSTAGSAGTLGIVVDWAE